MGPYRTPGEPPRIAPEPEPRDDEDLVVHTGIALVGVVGVVMSVVERDFHASATLAAILVVVGVVGIVRR